MRKRHRLQKLAASLSDSVRSNSTPGSTLRNVIESTYSFRRCLKLPSGGGGSVNSRPIFEMNISITLH